MAAFPALQLLSIFGLLCCFYHVSQAGHHSDHTVQSSMDFNYDPDSKYLIASTHSTCYMVKLTVGESDHVHTDQGIEELQLKMIHDWLGTFSETKVYHDDRSLPHNIGNWCKHHDIFLLNRVLPVEPSHSSPFSTSPRT